MKTRSILRQADAGVVASGTATIEAALQRCPMLVIYKTSAVTYALGKLLVKLDYLGMVNIVAGKELCPEFIQADATPEKLCVALDGLLSNEEARNQNEKRSRRGDRGATGRRGRRALRSNRSL